MTIFPFEGEKGDLSQLKRDEKTCLKRELLYYISVIFDQGMSRTLNWCEVPPTQKVQHNTTFSLGFEPPHRSLSFLRFAGLRNNMYIILCPLPEMCVNFKKDNKKRYYIKTIAL